MMTKAKEDLSVIQKNLEDVYGQVSVDIKTGEIKEDDTKD
jgi:hypothetical protein